MGAFFAELNLFWGLLKEKHLGFPNVIPMKRASRRQVYLMIKYNDMLLVESHEQDGSNGNIIRTRNYLPGVRMRVEDGPRSS